MRIGHPVDRDAQCDRHADQGRSEYRSRLSYRPAYREEAEGLVGATIFAALHVEDLCANEAKDQRKPDEAERPRKRLRRQGPPEAGNRVGEADETDAPRQGLDEPVDV